MSRKRRARTTESRCSSDSVRVTGLPMSAHVLTSTLAVSNQDTTLIDSNQDDESPVLKGYLNKYTNVARGYGTRWFVLRDGILSCTDGIYPGAHFLTNMKTTGIKKTKPWPVGAPSP
jgi:hypothetical protein